MEGGGARGTPGRHVVEDGAVDGGLQAPLEVEGALQLGARQRRSVSPRIEPVAQVLGEGAVTAG
jgi:hypothetical protein